jgi:hypothetical protein
LSEESVSRPKAETFDKMLTALAFVESIINHKTDDTQLFLNSMNMEDLATSLVFALTQTLIDDAKNSGRTVRQVMDDLREMCLKEMGADSSGE